MSISKSEADNNDFNANNENISVTISKRPHCWVKFDVHVQPHAVEASYQKAVKNVIKEVTIPGFRKGKAPESFIKEKYQSTIQKEFVDLVLQTGFNEALQLTHIHPLKDGQMHRPVLHECHREKGAHFTLEFEIRPIIPIVNVNEIKIKRVLVNPVTEQDIQNAIQNLQSQLGTYEPIEGRETEENDFVNVSVSTLEEEPRNIIENQRTQVNATGLPPWLLKKVIGLKSGESAEGMIEQDSRIEQDPDFIPFPFRVTVHAIWKGTLPELEELTKKVGLSSVEDLHKKIRERLEKEMDDEAFNEEIQNLEKILLEKYPIDIPESYIKVNKEIHLKKYFEKHPKEISQDRMKELESFFEQKTILNLQLYLLMHKIASDNNIVITKEELTDEFNNQIALLPSGRSSIDFEEKEKLYEQLFDSALSRKVKQFLIENVTFEE